MSKYSGRIKITLRDAREGINISTNPEEVITELKPDGNNYYCYLTPKFFNHGAGTVIIIFHSGEWNSGRSVTVRVEDVNGTVEPKNEGSITSNDSRLVIMELGQDGYEILIDHCACNGTEEIAATGIPYSLEEENPEELGTELLERIEADIELVKGYRAGEEKKTGVETGFEKLREDIRLKRCSIGEETAKKLLELERQLGELILGKEAAPEEENTEETD